MKKANQILAVLGVICGITTIIFGSTVLKADYGAWQDMAVWFGADFYTESYQAIARAANNVLEMTKILRSGFAYLLMSVGAFETLYFGNLVLKEFDFSKSVKEPEAEAVLPEVSENEINTEEVGAAE